MRSRLQKAAAVLLALTVLSLAACGNDGTTTTSKGGANVAGGSTTAASSGSAASGTSGDTTGGLGGSAAGGPGSAVPGGSGGSAAGGAGGATTGGSGGSGSVGLWDRFETTISNAKSYADPFRSVHLEVTYARPDGSTVKFPGFYDGGSTWKLRFMPNVIGRWTWTAAFSDGTPGASGSFSCVPSTLPGMLTKDVHNPVWFGMADGRPVLLRSLQIGDRFFAANWPAASRSAFLDWAQQQGYNMLSIGSHYLNRNQEGRGAGWTTPNLWPQSPTTTPGEYAKMESILDDLARRGFYVFPWAGFFGRSSNYPTVPADQAQYIEYTLARIGPMWNAILNVAGPEPNNGNWISAADVDRLGAAIQVADVFGHALGVHNAAGPDIHVDMPWPSYACIQGPHTTDPATMYKTIQTQRHPQKPVYASETLWMGNVFQPAFTLVDLRKLSFTLNMAAATHNMGDMNGNSTSGFTATLDLADKIQARHDVVKKVWDFFATIPFSTLSPHPELTSTGFCLAALGTRYLVYLPTTAAVNVTVVPGKTYTVSWFDGATTTKRPGGTTTSGQGLTPPSGGDDWALLLEAP